MNKSKSRFANIYLLMAIILVSIGVVSVIWYKNYKRLPGNQSEIKGKVLSKSDVMNVKDVPLRNVTVIAIKINLYQDLVKDRPNDQYPILSQAIVDEYKVAVGKSDESGSYFLSVDPGNYFLCIGNIGRDETMPVYVNGCMEVIADLGRRTNKNIFWGEGGVTAN